MQSRTKDDQSHVKRELEAKGFENLEAWKAARELTNRIYDITREGPIARDHGFIDQIRRASISVMNNLAEGYERGSRKDFSKFLFISRGSAAEVRSMLYIALDQRYVTQDTFQSCYDLSIRCSQLCWGLIRYNLKVGDLKTKAVTLALIVGSFFSLFKV